MAKAYPSSSVTVFDLPQVVEMAQKHFCQDATAVVFQTGEPRSASFATSLRWYDVQKHVSVSSEGIRLNKKELQYEDNMCVSVL